MLDDEAAYEYAVAALRAGGVVVLPTDTVYGIAALPHLAEATEKLFAIKERGEDVPIAVLCADAGQAFDLTTHVTPEVRRIAARLWPGPLTLVLRRRADLLWRIGEPSTTIGVRCPAHDLVRRLIKDLGPLATTSANRHGMPTPPTLREVMEQLRGSRGVEAVLIGGRCEAPPSTVVDCTTDDWKVLRAGAIDAATLLAAARA